MWKVVCEPEGRNPGVLGTKKDPGQGVMGRLRRSTDETEELENMSGMVVYLVNGSQRQEVSRVAYIRREGVCKNPNKDFKTQLKEEIEKAKAAVEQVNGLVDDSKALR